MSMDVAFIGFFDLSQECKYLFVSASVHEIIGYNPEELVGTSLFSYIHPDEVEVLQKLNASIIREDQVATLTCLRLKNKNGEWVTCQIVGNMVYDCLVIACGLMPENPHDPRNQARIAKAEWFAKISDNGEIDVNHESWERQGKLKKIVSEKLSWPEKPVTEPRTVAILNRFSKDLPVMFISDESQRLLGLDSSCSIIGRNFISFVHSESRDNFRSDVNIAKSSNSISYSRFKFKSPKEGPIKVEAVIVGSMDGVVIVIRRQSNEINEANDDAEVTAAKKSLGIILSPSSLRDPSTSDKVKFLDVTKEMQQLKRGAPSNTNPSELIRPSSRRKLYENAVGEAVASASSIPTLSSAFASTSTLECQRAIAGSLNNMPRRSEDFSPTSLSSESNTHSNPQYSSDSQNETSGTSGDTDEEVRRVIDTPEGQNVLMIPINFDSLVNKGKEREN